MIKSVTVINEYGDILDLILAEPEKSGLAVRSISGLGPAKSNINVSESINLDGGIYNSSRLQTRNIVLSLIFLWNQTIEESRLLTYKFFPIKKNIKFIIETDARRYETNGYIESNEPNIFDNMEGCDISIVCPDPYFYDDVYSSINFDNRIPLFEFPFSNESLTEDLLIVEDTEIFGDRNIIYESTIETGIIITIEVVKYVDVDPLFHSLAGLRDFTLVNENIQKRLDYDFSVIPWLTGVDWRTEWFNIGDKIVINTLVGEKSVTLYKGNRIINAIEGLKIYEMIDDDLDPWLYLTKGDNRFYYSATRKDRQTGEIEDAEDYLKVSISYKTKYQGV